MELERIHRKLLTDISDQMVTDSMECENFIEHMKTYVPTGILAQNKSLLGKFETMESRGHLKPGHYEDLKKICTSSGNFDILEMVKEAESKIEQLQQGTSDGNLEHESDWKEPPVKKMKYADIEKDLQSDLIDYYREICSTIPICPCLEEVDAPLIKVYTPPFPLYLRETDKLKQIFEQTEELENETIETPSVDSLDKIFNKQSKECNKIYLTAEPGLGKTSFTKWLALNWCQAHSPEDDDVCYFEHNDVSQMKNFEFLFLIFLRETDVNERHVDSMITNHILSALGRHSAYTTEVLTEVLYHKKCLIILDGLDEWSLSDIPRRSTRKNCTYLSTSRPWKFCMLPLDSTKIDQHVCIENVAKICKEKLVSNVMSLFEERRLLRSDISNQVEACKLFKRKLDEMKITHVYNTPVILVQLITSWNINKEIGQSNCEIYTGIVDTFFSIAEKKVKLLAKFKKVTASNINCFHDSPSCATYYNLMIRLGKLAFETLFCEQKGPSLIFGKNVALTHLRRGKKISSEDTLATCLQTGLLSMQSFYVRAKMKIDAYSFFHKTIQEFFAALYIQSEYAENVRIEDAIMKRCNSVSAVLEMATVFTFLSGFDLTTAREVLQSLQSIINEDEMTKDYRCRFFHSRGDKEYTQVMAIQNMIVSCLTESIKNGHVEQGLPLQDIIIDPRCEQDSDPLKTLVNINSNTIKSLVFVRKAVGPRLSNEWIYLGLPEMQSVCKFQLTEIPFDEPDSLSRAQTRALVPNVIDQMIGLKTQQLELLYLHAHDSVAHNSIERFLYFVSQQTLLKEVDLKVKCYEHTFTTCKGFQLDLCQQEHLQNLVLSDVPVNQLRVNEGLKILRLYSVPLIQIQLNEYLQNLFLYHIPVSQLQLNEHLKELILDDVPVTELHLNKHLQSLSLEKVPVSRILVNEQLQTLRLQDVSLSQLQLNDHLQNLSLIKVNVSQLHLNRHLNQLSLEEVPVHQIQLNEHLQKLRLEDVPVTELHLDEHLHDLTLRKLFISQLQLNEHLQSLHLYKVSASELHFNEALQRLSLLDVSVSQYQGNLSSLEFCNIYDLPAGAVSAVFRCLPAAPKLQKLECGMLKSPDVTTVLDTIPQLLDLHRIELTFMDLDERSLVLPNNMEHIEHMLIVSVTLTSRALNILVDRVMKYKQSVKVELKLLIVKDDTIGDQQETINPRSPPSNSDNADLSRYSGTKFELLSVEMSSRAFRNFVDTLEKCKRPVVVYIDYIDSIDGIKGEGIEYIKSSPSFVVSYKSFTELEFRTVDQHG
ncbi:uncharacterized protein LOC123527689 [Mercenaria mercenaria]|uniref:uncharacterized protein LOC123527689 n=1 Tax=Mercenaria mercenaria TaxID=6596 RepID=UPI00234ED393|nr:uncharacterized protein LOC123527689 [Mercenaria mercenaria]